MPSDDFMNVMREAAESLQSSAKGLRRCGMCHTWNSRPCGDQCGWSPDDPLFVEPAAPVSSASDARTLTDEQVSALRYATALCRGRLDVEAPFHREIIKGYVDTLDALLSGGAPHGR